LVGWPSGSQNDSIDRVIAQALQKVIKQPVVIQNVPGGGGSLVLNRVKIEKPDGYTLFQTGTSRYYSTAHERAVPFDIHKDFAYLAQHAKFQYILEDRPDNPWKNFDELILYVKKNPKKVRYSTPGVGGGHHLIMEYLALKENLQWIHVPFNSGTEATTAMLGGHVEILPSGFTAVDIEYFKAGRIRPLLALGDKRLPLLPDIPTILEKGYDFNLFSAA
jgi:tripartite-type tricarboxylate transporter receptor subunit TctC